MKTHSIITTIIAAAMMFTSCTEDVNVEPDMEMAETSYTYEEQYLLAIRAETGLTVTDFCDQPQCAHAMPLTGDGLAFSNTFGPMDVKTNLAYDMTNGRLTGTISFTVRNSNETLEITIKEKGKPREWHDLNGSCIAANSTESFAGMNFIGQMCFEQLPADIRSLENGFKAVILIEGELK